VPDFNAPLQESFACGRQSAASFAHAGICLRENTSLALATLALRKGAARPAPFGMALPEIADLTRQGAYGAFWTGPEAWIVEGHYLAATDFAAAVKAAAPDCSVNEQTDGFCCFEITSSHGAAQIDRLIEKLVNADPRRLRAVRTTFDHMATFVLRRSESELAVIGMRSAAGSIFHALETAIARMEPVK